VAFERALRERVGDAMSETTTPADLRERISAALAAAGADAEPGTAATSGLAGAGGDEGVIPRRDRRFWAGGGGAAFWASLAASMLIVIGVFTLVPRGGSQSAEGVLARASEHVSAEHLGCINDGSYFRAKLEAPATGAASEAAVSMRVGGLPVNLRLGGSGYELSGVGECHVPGGGASVHLLYEPRDPSASESVSLFVQEVTAAHEGMREGVVYTNARPGPPMVRIWREGGVVYFAVTRCPKACDALESAYALTGERTPL